MQGIIYKTQPYLERKIAYSLIHRKRQNYTHCTRCSKNELLYRVLGQYLTQIDLLKHNKSMYSLKEVN
jgi:hypothetical protein